MQLQIEPLPWARELLNDLESDVVAVTAGLGAGKTHAANQKHFLLSLINDKSPFSAYVLPTHSEIKGIGFPRMEETLIEAGLTLGKDFEIYTSQLDPKVVLKITGQEIKYLSAHKPQRIRAFEYSHASGDEVGDWPYDEYRNLRSRVRCRRAKVRQTILWGAPQGIGWFADEFDSDTIEGWNRDKKRDHWKVSTVSERGVDYEFLFRRLRVRTDDNPFLPSSYVAELVQNFAHNKNKLKSYREGIFAPFYEGNAVQAFNEERHLQDLEINEHLPIYFCWDFNHTPLANLVMQIQTFEDPQWGRENKYCFLSESSGNDSLILDAVDEFCARYPIERFGRTPIYLFGDRSGHSRSHKVRGSDYETIHKKLKEKGFERVEIRATKRVAPEAESIEALNKGFSYDRILVDNSCKNLIRGYQSARWKEGERKLDKSKKDMNASGEKSATYYINWVDASKYPIWQLEFIDERQAEKRIHGTYL